MDGSSAVDIEKDINDALSDILHKHRQGMVLKFVVCVEISDEDGERGMWTFTHLGASPWDTLGLLEYGITLEHAAVFNAEKDRE